MNELILDRPILMREPDCPRVYQGGHHSVYCSGETHITTFFNGWADSPHAQWPTVGRINECDCRLYRADHDK